MVGVNCREFTTKFFEYARMVPALASPEPVLISRYIWGLVSEICDLVKAARPQTIGETVELANTLTYGLICTQEEGTSPEDYPRTSFWEYLQEERDMPIIYTSFL